MNADKSPLELAALATVAVPGLRVTGLRPPQFSDEIVSITGIIDSTGNRWTVVCPHDTVGGLGLESQTAVLTRLARASDAGEIPFDVPRPAGFTRTPEGGRVMVHRDLGGRFMTEEDFADPHVLPSSLGRALAALHNLPESVCTGVDLPSYSAEECRARHLALLDEVATTGAVPRNLWDRWEGALDDIALWRFRTTPVHGDFQPTTILVDAGSVMGLTGFSSMHVGDPAEDIAWVLARASDGFLGRFQEAYSMTRRATDLHLATRAQLLSELAVVRWLAHGLHAEDESVVEDARSMLAQLADELGGDQLVRPREFGATPAPSSAPAPGVDPASGTAPAPTAASTPGPAVPRNIDEGGAGAGDTHGQGHAATQPSSNPDQDGHSWDTEGTVQASPSEDLPATPTGPAAAPEDPEAATGPLPLSEAPTESLDIKRP
ncbi:MAG: phosphotransferase [Pauljensenia sp.]